MKIPIISWVFKMIKRMILFSLISSIVVIVLLAVGGLILYNSFTIKTISFCLGEEEKTTISCSVNNDCINNITNVIKDSGISGMENVVELSKSMFAESISCKESSCYIKKSRGLEEAFKPGAEKVECSANETIKTVKITPKTIVPPDKMKKIFSLLLKPKEAINIISGLMKGKLPSTDLIKEQ